jgi:hypothetical protein
VLVVSSVWLARWSGVAHPWVGRSDKVNLGVLTQFVPPGLVDGAIAGRTRDKARRAGALSMRFAVYYELALALFPHESLEDVCDNLTGAIPELGELAPAKSALHGARVRLGPEAMRRVFEQLAEQATEPAVGGRWRGLRTLAVDGFVVELPDSVANREHFGAPVTVRGRGAGVRATAYPQARVVTLVATGTRAVRAAAIGAYRDGEFEMARQVAAATGEGDVVIFDRGLRSVKLWQAYREQGAHLVMRAAHHIAREVVEPLPDGTTLVRMWLDGRHRHREERSVVMRLIEYQVDDGETIRLLTSLTDTQAHPAAEIARLYAARWQSEISNLQIKTLQITPGKLLRSHHPDQVHQEIWAHLTLQHALNRLITVIADERRDDPERISFTKILKEVRRSVIRQTAATLARAVTRALDIADDLRRYRNPWRPPRTSERSVKRIRNRYPHRTNPPGHPVTTPAPPRTIRLLTAPAN